MSELQGLGLVVACTSRFSCKCQLQQILQQGSLSTALPATHLLACCPTEAASRGYQESRTNIDAKHQCIWRSSLIAVDFVASALGGALGPAKDGGLSEGGL